MAENTAEQAGQTAESGGGETKTFTQAQVDEIVSKRVARVKATPPDDYEELKSKAARLDELEEASKTELQKATERADKLKAELDGMKAEQERREQIARFSAQYAVDADLLARMAGDVEESAKYLSERQAQGSRYPVTRDAGEPATNNAPDAARQAAAMLFGRH